MPFQDIFGTVPDIAQANACSERMAFYLKAYTIIFDRENNALIPLKQL